MGKGSAPRPMPDYDTYSTNYDSIFKKDKMKLKDSIMPDLPPNDGEPLPGVVFSYKPREDYQGLCYCILMGEETPNLSCFPFIQQLFTVNGQLEAITTWNWLTKNWYH